MADMNTPLNIVLICLTAFASQRQSARRKSTAWHCIFCEMELPVPGGEGLANALGFPALDGLAFRLHGQSKPTMSGWQTATTGSNSHEIADLRHAGN
jgi:hypothetical protein